jgi:Protein of unknown function (DUF3563)
MKSRTLWDEPLGTLMASGSPGSALAYHLGQTVFEPGMAQRTMAREAPANGALVTSPTTRTQTKSDAPRAPSIRGWLGRVFDRLEAWSWEREMREREAYLAQAQDLYDLEARMRRLDGDEFSRRGRALG